MCVHTCEKREVSRQYRNFLKVRLKAHHGPFEWMIYTIHNDLHDLHDVDEKSCLLFNHWSSGSNLFSCCRTFAFLIAWCIGKRSPKCSIFHLQVFRFKYHDEWCVIMHSLIHHAYLSSRYRKLPTPEAHILRSVFSWVNLFL